MPPPEHTQSQFCARASAQPLSNTKLNNCDIHYVVIQFGFDELVGQCYITTLNDC